MYVGVPLVTYVKGSLRDRNVLQAGDKGSDQVKDGDYNEKPYKQEPNGKLQNQQV